MPYKKISDANSAIRGIKPPVTLAQANMIAAWAEGEGLQQKEKAGEIKSAWAVAIAQFKRTHTASGGKWVKKKTEKGETTEELATKELDELNQRMDAIYGAFYKAFRETVQPVEEAQESYRIAGVYEDHVLASRGTKTFRVGYTINDDGVVEFGDPEEGQLEFVKHAAEKATESTLVGRGIAILTIKAVQEGDDRFIEGYATLWDQIDLEGEVMTKDAIAGHNLERFMQRPMLFWRHGRDPSVGLTPVGKVLKAEVDDVGLWVKAVVFKGLEVANRVWDLIQQGVRSFSVGAVQKFVKRIGDRIVDWPLAEISIEPLSALTGATFEIVPTPEWSKALGLEESREEQPMEKELNVEEVVTKVVATLEQKALDRAEHTRKQKEHDEAIATAAITAYQEKLREQGPVESKAIFGDDVDLVRKPITLHTIYDDQKLSGLCLSYAFLKASGKAAPSEYLQKAILAKASKSLDAGDLASKCLMSEKGLELDQEMSLAVKANELMYSTQASGGDEWVYTVWSRDVWRKVRADVKLLQYLREVEVEGESLTIPIESTDPVIYKVGEATDLDNLQFSASGVVGNYDSKAATGNKTLTPSKIGGLVIWTGELTERSIVAMSSMIQDQFLRGFKEKTEEILISGDVATGATNISDYGNGSISTYWRLLTLDGLRNAWITENSGNNSRDGGALSAEDFPATRKLMGTNGKLGLKPERLKLVMDAGMYYKLLTLGEVLTQDKWQRAATIVDGKLERIFGSEVIPSGEYGATDTSGYIHNTAGNNVKGSFFYFDPVGFLVGRGRKMDAEVHRVPWADAYYLVGFASLALVCFDWELIAGSYNLTV